jgi:uncharacterized damage-inducible protein DinB
MSRPAQDEYAEYYHRYVALVPDGDVLDTLASQFDATLAPLRRVGADRETWAYAPGKWTIRQSVGHVIDAERVFAGRALWMARATEVELPSMDQDAWVESSPDGRRPLSVLLDEWSAVRAATLALFGGLDAEAQARVGTASGVRFTVRSLAWVIAGHELHHRALFRDRYDVD